MVENRFVGLTTGLDGERLEKPFESPLEKLKRTLSYESASFDESMGTIVVGSKVFANCEKMDVGGIQSTKYTAKDEAGQVVIVKIRKAGHNQQVSNIETRIEDRWGESEEIVDFTIDEAPLSLLADCKIGEKSRPALIACGKLPDGSSMFVEEMISGKGPVDALYSLKDNFVDRYSKCGEGDEEERQKLQKEAEFIKTSLLLMFRDSVTTIEAMFETGVFVSDLKIYDYIVKTEPLNQLATPKKLEDEWRGVFVDWGVSNVRVDKAERPLAEKKNLFLVSMQEFLHGKGAGVYGNFFLQYPRLSDNIEMFDDVKDPLEELMILIKREKASQQDDFSAQGKKIFAKLSAVAEKIGLKMRFEFPL